MAEANLGHNERLIERCLDLFEVYFRALGSSADISAVEIERERWDLPLITLTWLGSDFISRNINVLVALVPELSEPLAAFMFTSRIPPETEEYFLVATFMLEINAWKDIDNALDLQRLRKWMNQKLIDAESIYARDITYGPESRFEETIRRAFTTASQMQENDLTKQTQIPPNYLLSDSR